MSSTKPTNHVLEHLFLAPYAPLGEAWLQAASIQLSYDSMHCLVLTSKILSIIKARSSYGHFCTASKMQKVLGIQWPSESGLAASLQQEPLHLNPQQVSPLFACLKSLHSDTIGGIILVTVHYYSDGRVSKPYLTIVAAPLLMPIGQFLATDPLALTMLILG
jgi:hypothetical protein